MVMCFHTEIFRFSLLFQLRRMVFLATVRAMSTVFMLWLGIVADDNSSNKHSDGESGNQAVPNCVDVVI